MFIRCLTTILVVGTLASAQTVRPEGLTKHAQLIDDPLGQIQPAPIDEDVPLDVGELIERGNRLMKANRPDEAIAQYRAALDKAKKPLLTVYLNLGAAYLEKKDYTTAAEFYRKAIAMRPGNVIAHFSLGDTLFAMGDLREAEKEYRKSIELTPGGNNPPAHHFLGLSLYEQRRVDEAIAAYLIAIDQLKGNYAEARYNLGIALLSRNELGSAEREFRLALEQQKKDWPEAHFNLGATLERLGRFREAADEYEIYLRQAPGSEDATHLRRHIEKLRSRR